MAWAIAAGHAVDDRFEAVASRDMTKEERLAGDRRRALTSDEMKKLFNSPLFSKPPVSAVLRDHGMSVLLRS